MITNAILSLIFGLIGLLLNLIPTLDFPWTTSIANSILYLAGIIGKANAFIPVSDVFIVLGAIVSIPVFKFFWFIINWIIRRIVDVIP